MHTVSGRWQLGLILSLTTVFLWGLLPIALKGVLLQMDAVTVTWYRFAVAGIFLFFYMLFRRRIPSLKALKGFAGLLMLIAVLGLCANYVFYLFGVDKITPSSAQVMIQTAPMFMLLGGLIVFKESFNKWQWLGFCSFVIGLILFFNMRFEEILNNIDGAYTVGLFWMFLAAITWAGYALAQKQLLNTYSSNQIMFIIYITCVFILLPWSEPSQVMPLNTLGWGLLVFCCLNTIVAYGAFAEALAHWEATRVSAILALTPLVTILAMKVVAYFFPAYLPSEPLNALSIVGSIMVVLGSATTALAGKRKSKIIKKSPSP
ncbi:DMT family transporter [Kangiella sediminilitoris]|uniref:Membrane protein n=1 Tax=Kangiella sediminilitoris TaxID=1144748 RepID=A0A1B3BCA1_9GAMM|nr:DMT family transporter [Kangiella sediminilitoris]AOE50439.1 membrane protein [Kangiella sediminilitoris]